MKYWLLKLFLHGAAHLPLSLGRRIGVLLGSFCWHSSGRMQRTTMINLARCLPELSASERTALGRESLQHTMQTLMESGAVWLWPTSEALALIQQVENFSLLEEAKAEQKGVIVLAPHLGNWELLGLYLNACGLGQSYQLYQAPASEQLSNLIYKARSRAGATMVATDNKGVAELLRALRAGNIAGILPDQVPPKGSGEFASFFGVEALTMTLLVKLQQKTGARVVVAYAKRVAGPAGAGFHMVFRAPDPEVYAGSMQTALAAMNRSIESLVREAPEQYQWEYKRFKRQPEGVPKAYQD